MDKQASSSTEATIDAEPREAPRPRHLHFRRRRVLWALGLDNTRESGKATQAAAH